MIVKDPRKTMAIPRREYEKLMSKQGTCVIDGKKYQRLANGAVTAGDDICVTNAIPGAIVADTGVLVYYRLVPPPPPAPPSRRVLERVRAGEATADELVLVAVWAQHQIER